MKTQRKVALFMCAVMFASVLSVICSFQTSAASYSGRGSKSDPYLVQTAEQLQGMKDNLSAHYKLANTIDLAGQTFTPIGHEGSPFTGSFVCDTNSDGTPKYAIKNLKVSIVMVPNYADYVEGKNKWQASLFGATRGATISSIALLDVNISNTIEGKNQMNSDWSVNPGMGSCAAAALIGLCEKTTVTGCSATGVIDSKSNQTGGLIGCMNGSTVSRCYTKVTIKQTGRWGNGGFAGYISGGSKVTECFSETNLATSESSSTGFDAGANTSGGFSGDCGGSTVENCYSTGNVGAYGESFTGMQSSPKSLKNCYATGKVSGESSVKGGTSTDNCFILNQAGCVQQQFTAASAEQIKSAFASNAVWNTSGSLPTLKNVAVIKNAASYVPGAVTDNTSGGGNTASGSTEDVAGTISGETVVTKMTPAEYAEKVAAYLTKAQNGELTSEEAYEVLSFDEIKAEMSSEELVELATLNPNINEDYDELLTKVQIVLISSTTEAIEALPAVDEVEEEDMDTIMQVYEDFQKLPEDYQQAIDQELVDKLNACYEKVYQMKYVTVMNQKTDRSGFNVLELILIVTFGVLCLAAFVGVVIVTVKIVKFTKSEKRCKHEGK